ncbi:uncharacterized protein LOC144720752 isoform X5 [Lampetra planeri]
MDSEGLPGDVAALIREMDNFLRAIADEKMDVKTKVLKISLQKRVQLCRDQYRLDLTHRDEEEEEDEDEDMYDDACGTTWAHDIAPSQPLTWNNKSVAPAAGAPSHENAIKEGYLEVKKRDAGRGDVDQALNAFCVLTARELRLYGDKKVHGGFSEGRRQLGGGHTEDDRRLGRVLQRRLPGPVGLQGRRDGRTLLPPGRPRPHREQGLREVAVVGGRARRQSGPRAAGVPHRGVRDVTSAPHGRDVTCSWRFTITSKAGHRSPGKLTHCAPPPKRGARGVTPRDGSNNHNPLV